jgi:hypothetical protein
MVWLQSRLVQPGPLRIAGVVRLRIRRQSSAVIDPPRVSGRIQTSRAPSVGNSARWRRAELNCASSVAIRTVVKNWNPSETLSRGEVLRFSLVVTRQWEHRGLGLDENGL